MDQRLLGVAIGQLCGICVCAVDTTAYIYVNSTGNNTLSSLLFPPPTTLYCAVDTTAYLYVDSTGSDTNTLSSLLPLLLSIAC